MLKKILYSVIFASLSINTYAMKQDDSVGSPETTKAAPAAPLITFETEGEDAPAAALSPLTLVGKEKKPQYTRRLATRGFTAIEVLTLLDKSPKFAGSPFNHNLLIDLGVLEHAKRCEKYFEGDDLKKYKAAYSTLSRPYFRGYRANLSEIDTAIHTLYNLANRHKSKTPLDIFKLPSPKTERSKAKSRATENTGLLQKRKLIKRPSKSQLRRLDKSQLRRLGKAEDLAAQKTKDLKKLFRIMDEAYAQENPFAVTIGILSFMKTCGLDQDTIPWVYNVTDIKKAFETLAPVTFSADSTEAEREESKELFDIMTSASSIPKNAVAERRTIAYWITWQYHNQVLSETRRIGQVDIIWASRLVQAIKKMNKNVFGKKLPRELKDIHREMTNKIEKLGSIALAEAAAGMPTF